MAWLAGRGSRRIATVVMVAIAALAAGCGRVRGQVGSDAAPGAEDAATVGEDAAPDAGAAPDHPTPDGGEGPSRRNDHDTLFIGNSYVYVNDVAGHYRTIVSALAPGTRVEEVAPGGYKLVQHAADARTDGTALARWLHTGTTE